MTEVDILYKNYDILNNASEKITEHQNEYELIISAAAGNSSEKRLACQFIPQFFRNFPDLMNKALNAHLDLCEDLEPSIRRLAIKALPGFCIGLTGVVSRIAAILTQMLYSEDPIEFNIIQTSIYNLFVQYPENTLRGLFEQLQDVEAIVRFRALKFVNDNILKHSLLKEKTLATLLVEGIYLSLLYL
ncbi:hypothetical protein HZS_547 [Henneguya salminicola]|nr:hypothetical protein HZS_547 [Henneguya salminicola]